MQEESNVIHEQTCHKTDDIFIQPDVKEQSPDILYEYNSFSSFNCLPKYDEYDDDYEPNDQISLAEESEPILAERTVQDQQPKINDQRAYLSYEVMEESAENFDFSEGNLPFCVDSFQFIKENYHAVNKQVSASVDINHLEEAQIIVQNILPLVLQPQKAIEYQIEEDSKAVVRDQVIQMDPLPLCFQPSEFFEEEVEHPTQISQGPYEPVCNKLQILVHVLYDSCADRVYDEVKKCSSPLACCVPQYQNVDDI